MGNNVDYRNVQIPEGMDPEDMEWQIRRAHILENYLLNEGHPDNVNWSRLAEYYDRSKETLHRDKKNLTSYLVDELDVDRISHISASLFEAGLLELQADEDMGPFDYHAFVSKWVSTLDDLGVLDTDADDVDELFASGDADGMTVAISGVSADDVDASELPEQDRPEEAEIEA